MNRSWLQRILYPVLALLIYFSWCQPGSAGAGAWAICSALLLAFLCCDSRGLSYRLIYLSGIIVNILGFYWLADTIRIFGGFPSTLAWIIFAFFVLVSALQFPLLAFFFKRLPKSLGNFKLALAWVSAEFLFPRIFPWELSHPLLGIPTLAQSADIAGTPLLSIILLAASSMLVCLFNKADERSKLPLAVSLASLLIVWITYGQICLTKYSNVTTDTFKVAVVQANVAVVQQGDLATIRQNKNQYIQLSKSISPDVDLLIWPESVVQDWIWVDTKRIENDPRLPYFGPQTSLITGALTFENQQRIFNSALLVDKDGEIPAPYHKRILMPFGEYMPFSEIFPWLNEINANLALFTPGTASKIFDIPVKNSQIQAVKVSPLVCYEDLIPRLSRTSTQLGAEVLINLTNDAWFGDGPAAVHHNMMASFRAIENRRFLVRSTNNGQTAVISPTGRSTASIPASSEGLVETEIQPLNHRTLFTEYCGPFLWWIISIAVFITSLRFRNKRFA